MMLSWRDSKEFLFISSIKNLKVSSNRFKIIWAYKIIHYVYYLDSNYADSRPWGLRERGDRDWPYVVVLLMSCTLCSGSMVSGQRRMQGANTMAKALADIRLVFSCRAILRNRNKNKTKHPSEVRIKMEIVRRYVEEMRERWQMTSNV